MNNLKSLPVHWFRFNLRALLALFVFVALGLTALKFSTAGWAAATATVTAGVLLFALLGWMHGREARRAYWSGFAVCGWGYLALIYVGGGIWHAPPGNDLATNDALEFMFRKFNPECEKLVAPTTRILLSWSSNSYTSYPAAYYNTPTPAVVYQPPPYSYPGVASPNLASPPPPLIAAGSDSDVALPPRENPSTANVNDPNRRSVEEPGQDSRPVPALDPSASVTRQPSVAAEDAPAAESPKAPIVPTPFVSAGPAPSAPSLAAGAPAYSQPTYLPASPYGYSYSGMPLTADQAAKGVEIQTRAQQFPAIGNCLFALVLGWVGAVAASGLAAGKRNAMASETISRPAVP